MDNYTLALFVFIAFLFISRMVNTQAIKKLEPLQKAALVDIFSKNTFLTLGILIAIFALYFVSMKYALLDLLWINILYLTALAAYSVVMAIYAYKKLKEHDFPNLYIRSYIVSTTLRFLGLGIFLVLLGM